MTHVNPSAAVYEHVSQVQENRCSRVAYYGFSCMLACLLLLLGWTTGCQPPATPPSSTATSNPNGSDRQDDTTGSQTQVRLALNWYPDSQHGGFYAADTQSVYQQAGLQVTIVPGGPAVPVIQNVALRRVEFGVANADQILLARAQGAPVVALFAALQTSPRCVMVHRKTGITQWSELKNVTLAMGPGQPFTVYLQKKMPLEKVNVVPYTGTIANFLSDPRFAQQAYSFSEPFVAKQQGADPLCLLAADLGYNTYTSCLFTHEALLREHPEWVRSMVTSVRQGWTDYFQNAQAAHERIIADNPQMDLPSLEFGLDTLRPLCQPPEMATDRLGQMDPARWEQLAAQLLEIGLLKEAQNASQAYTNDFLTDSAQEP